MKAKVLVLLLTVLAFSAFSQTKKEAYDAYNNAVSTYKQNPKGALDDLNKSLDICKQLGEDADEVRVAVEGLIPSVYFQQAMVSYKQKDLQGTLDNLEKAKETALQYENNSIVDRVDKTIPKLYNVMGNSKFKEDKFDEAIKNYSKAIAINPDYVDPYVGLTLSYEKMGNDDKMIETLNKTIEIAEKNNNAEVLSNTKIKAKAFYLKKADEAQKEKKYDEVVALLDDAIKYDEYDTDIYRLMAINYNRLERWEEGITAASKALELSKGTADQKAELYFLLATAYQNSNKVNEACEAYKNASYGAFKPNADYQIKQLKCQ
ncbi:MAG: tetratricopeptide repeat protein [Bacteroidales bacterium]|nr:tetratricopeptide repeat protein [Bacteroidales bacterium]HPD94349.1 tetratricopeptide repeat protein [Tenuifilaceae bacterium]HRX30864.1 tetratricopeptide repeat protein [Tenuifilaceae bacterium]